MSQDKKTNDSWFTHGSVGIHAGLAKYGFLVVKPTSSGLPENVQVTDESFDYGTRRLKLKDSDDFHTHQKKKLKDKSPYKKSNRVKLLEALCAITQEDDTTESDEVTLLSGLRDDSENSASTEMSSSPTDSNNNNALQMHSERTCIVKLPAEHKKVVNTHREEEVFTPLILKETKTRKKNGTTKIVEEGMYVYPSISSNESEVLKSFLSHFEGFEQAVTAGCLFGSNIKGIDKDYRINLIKHDIELRGQISKIEYESSQHNPYTKALFEQFKCFCRMFSAYGKTNGPKELLYHLPTWDYFLFGVELFIRGGMSLTALRTFFKAIRQEAQLHHHELTKTAKKYGIALTLASPFDGIFGNFFDRLRDDTTTEDALFDEVLQKLGAPHDNIVFNPEVFTQSSEKEIALVKRCTNRLCDESTNPLTFAIWRDFLENTQAPLNLEGLFKISNAVMIAIASNGKKDGQTVSLLPISEKMIQLGYAQHTKAIKQLHKEAAPRHYPMVVNLSVLEPLVTFGYTTRPNQNGNAFYFSEEACKSTLKSLQKHGLLKKMRGNTAKCFGNKGVAPLAIEAAVEKKTQKK